MRPLNQVSLPLLNDYNQAHFPAPRPDFLKAWVAQPGHLGGAFIEEDRLMGYGVIRSCLEGFKVGPLFANNPEVAQHILYYLLAATPEATVLIDVPVPNKLGLKLIQPFQPQKVFACARMYTQKAPDLNLQNIFGLNSFELG